MYLSEYLSLPIAASGCIGCSDAGERPCNIIGLLELVDDAAILDEPFNRPLDLAAWQRLEARQGAEPRDDGHYEVGFLLGRRDELAGISPGGEHGLDESPEAAGGAQQRLGAAAILDAAGMHLNREYTAASEPQNQGDHTPGVRTGNDQRHSHLGRQDIAWTSCGLALPVR